MNGAKNRPDFILMQIHYSSKTPLSDEAEELVDFDVDSIRHVIAAEHGPEPDLWLAAPEGYEANGHSLRDSNTIRLIAYSRSTCIVYATDGCNACRHVLSRPLESSGEDELAGVSAQIQLPAGLLGRLAEILREQL